MLGMALFIGFMVAGYKFFLKERIIELKQSGIALKIIFSVIAVIFSILMLAAIIFCLFLMAGLTDNMRPEWMLFMTALGWPIFTLVFLIIAEILAVKQ